MRSRIVKFLLGIVAMIVAAFGILVILAEPAPDHAFFRDDDYVLVIAHRGGCGLAPENTIPAIRNAVEMGVDVIEMDVQLTKDGALVVIHDSTVNRVTNAAGTVRSYTLAELKRLDAGYNWTSDGENTHPYRGQGITIPTLSEVFDTFPDVRKSIEIKQPDTAAAIALCELIAECDQTDRVLVASVYGEAMDHFRRICPDVATSASKSEATLFFVLSMFRMGLVYSPSAVALQVPEYSDEMHIVTRGFIDAAHDRNMEVHVWTVNKIADMRRMIDAGVDGIITDYPDRLLGLDK